MTAAASSPPGIALLRLHADPAGDVWAGDDAQLGVPTRLGAAAFFASDVLGVPWGRVKAVRLLGVPANAELICQIQHRRAADPALSRAQRVTVFSPTVVGKADRANPPAVLQALWQPPATGLLRWQWHDLTPDDFCVYGMLTEAAKAGGVNDVVRRIALYHPAWPAVSFPDTLDVDVACRLLNEIVDPRWYVDPRRPERLNRLFSYLGLTPANVHAVLYGGAGDIHHDRAVLAVRAWYDPRAVASTRPRDFLNRACHGGRDAVRGVLRATQRFVTLVATYWLGAVARAHPEAGFQPALFFHTPEEVAAFARHTARAKKV